MDNQPQQMNFYPRRMADRLTKDQSVTVVGQIGQVDQGALTFSLIYNPQNHAHIRIRVKQTYDISNFKALKFVQVRGIVLQQYLVEMDAYNDLKASFDLPSYNEMLKLANGQFRQIFNSIK